MKRRMLSLAAFAALLFVTTAFAAKGGSQTTANMLFDDLAGDAIQSDGLGAYAGAIRGRDGSLLISTGERSLLIDFGWGDGVREIVGMTIDVNSLDGTSATANFEVSYPDGACAITMSVSVSRSGDTYYLESTSDAEIWSAIRERVSRGTGNGGRLRWVLAGVAEMPWGAEVSVE